MVSHWPIKALASLLNQIQKLFIVGVGKNIGKGNYCQKGNGFHLLLVTQNSLSSWEAEQ